MATITIKSGFFSSGAEVNDVTLSLVESPVKIRPNDLGCTYVCKVDTRNTGLSQERKNSRIFLKRPSDFTIDKNGTVAVKSPYSEIESLTDEEIAIRNADKFGSLSLLSKAVSNLKIRALLVAGSPGTGKTYEVTRAVRSKKELYHSHIKGTISSIALYMELYRAKNGVIILDDSDESFTDPESIQLLKAAMESEKERRISYRKLSMALESEGIPQEFTFNGCVVILTNTDLENASKSKAPHYAALMSRSHYINVILATEREKLIRIHQVLKESKLLDNFVGKQHHVSIVEFLNNNVSKFKELSIRTVVKMAELAEAFPNDWQKLARGTLLK